jgi:hypothetical protein
MWPAVFITNAAKRSGRGGCVDMTIPIDGGGRSG